MHFNRNPGLTSENSNFFKTGFFNDMTFSFPFVQTPDPPDTYREKILRDTISFWMIILYTMINSSQYLLLFWSYQTSWGSLNLTYLAMWFGQIYAILRL